MKSSGFVLGAMMLLAVVVFAAPLLAGDLNPPGAPAPTMKTLDQIPPTWDQIIPNAADRFKLVMGGAAVLDKETGLVWEKSPDTTNQLWASAIFGCAQKIVGGRKGWRLPTIQELASLVAPGAVNPALPTGHSFTNVQSSAYWSATTYASNTSAAWYVDFSGGYMDGTAKTTNSVYVWCVRGGQGVDPQ